MNKSTKAERMIDIWGKEFSADDVINKICANFKLDKKDVVERLAHEHDLGVWGDYELEKKNVKTPLQRAKEQAEREK